MLTKWRSLRRAGLMFCAAMLCTLTFGSLANAQTVTISGWTLYTSGTLAPGGGFTTTYSGEQPRFRWSVDTAHSTNVQMMHCDGGGWYPWSSPLGIGAHSQSYGGFTLNGAPFLVWPGYCGQLGGWSNDGAQGNLSGYLLT